MRIKSLKRLSLLIVISVLAPVTLYSCWQTYRFGRLVNGTFEIKMANKICRVDASKVDEGFFLIRGRNNDGRERYFIVDTGAGGNALLTADAAREIGLGSISLGEGYIPALPWRAGRNCYENLQVEFGCAGLKAPLAGQLLNARLTRGEEPPAGLIGQALFAGAVVEMDYVAPALTIYEGSAFSYRGKGEALPLEVRPTDGMKNAPLVEVVVTPAAGEPPVKLRMLVDTGHTGALVIFSRTVKSHGWERFVEGFREAEAAGVSGPISSRVGRLSLAEVGSLKFPNPVTHVSGDIFSDAHVDGVIGYGILEHCRVTLDLPRRTMYLERVVTFGD